MPSNYIFSVCEDENNFLWVGTDKGLCRYNGFNWQVWDKDNGLPGNYIHTVLPDKRGGLWIDITGKGAFHFNIASGKAEKVSALTLNFFSLMEVDDKGDLFSLSPTDGEENYQGIIITPRDLSKSHTVFRCRQPAGCTIKADLASRTVYCLFIERTTNLENQVSYEGEWKMKYKPWPSSGGYESVRLVNDSIIITASHYYKYTTEGKLVVQNQLFQSNNSYTYACLTKKGCYINDVKTGYYFISNAGAINFFSSKSGLGTDYVNQVYEMNDGTVVFATLGKGIAWSKTNYKTTYSTGGKVVRAIVQDNGTWYVLAADEVFAINQSFQHISEMGGVKNSASTIFKSGDHIIIGSLQGIDFYALKNNFRNDLFVQFTAGISSVMKIAGGFIGSSYGNGLIGFNERSTTARSLRSPMEIIEKAIPLARGYAVLSYEDGVILSDTVSHTDLHLTKKEGLLSNTVNFIHEYKDSVWIATKYGVSVYTKGLIVKSITYSQGFIGARAEYCFHDKYGKLWVVSDKCLHLYDGNNLRAITSYPLLPGEDERILTAEYDDHLNLLAIGSNKSVSIITLENVLLSSMVLIPRILEVRVDGKMVDLRKIKVRNDFEKITLDIAPYASSPLYRGTLFYKLKGRDDKWEELKDSLSVSYEALRPGNYSFVAKTKNADGYSGEEKTLVSFIVNKPFWQRPWFLILLLLLTIAMTILIVKRVDAVKEQKKIADLLMGQALQNERERISKDLHDHLGSSLVTMVAQVDNIETRLSREVFPEVSGTVRQLSSQVREVMTILRETIWAVQENEHSLDSFVLRIRTFLQRLFENSSITWHMKVIDGESVKLSPKQTLQLFRILQEASQNILKHSKASEIYYQFQATRRLLVLKISDNGIGFNEDFKSTDSNGLRNIRQRVTSLDGEIVFESLNGTRISIDIPI